MKYMYREPIGIMIQRNLKYYIWYFFIIIVWDIYHM